MVSERGGWRGGETRVKEEERGERGETGVDREKLKNKLKFDALYRKWCAGQSA